MSHSSRVKRIVAEEKSMRQKYINSIMKSKHGDDDPNDSQNLAFLETLRLDELARLADGEFEEEFELEGEVKDIDFSDEELGLL
jgi:hypothetical protein